MENLKDELGLTVAVGAIVYVVEAEVLAWRRMVELKTKDRGESKG